MLSIYLHTKLYIHLYDKLYTPYEYICMLNIKYTYIY